MEHHSQGVLFLGYRLFSNYNSKLNLNVWQKSNNGIKFSIPIKNLIKCYATKGFMQRAKKGKNVKYVAKRVDKWIFLPSDEIVIKKFNFIDLCWHCQ